MDAFEPQVPPIVPQKPSVPQPSKKKMGAYEIARILFYISLVSVFFGAAIPIIGPFLGLFATFYAIGFLIFVFIRSIIGAIKERRANVFLVNFIIFLVYSALSTVIGGFIPLFSGGSFLMITAWITMLIHVPTLIIISVIQSVRASITKTNTHAGDYFLTAIFMFIIGFGACTFGVSGF